MRAPDHADVVRREQQLLDPVTRQDPEAATRLLHPDFVEFGSSGQVWDRDGVLAMMASDPGAPAPAYDFEPAHLAEDVVLLTYRTAKGTLRSSVWVRDPDDGWVVRFHQGTPAPG